MQNKNFTQIRVLVYCEVPPHTHTLPGIYPRRHIHVTIVTYRVLLSLKHQTPPPYWQSWLVKMSLHSVAVISSNLSAEISHNVMFTAKRHCTTFNNRYMQSEHTFLYVNDLGYVTLKLKSTIARMLNNKQQWNVSDQ